MALFLPILLVGGVLAAETNAASTATNAPAAKAVPPIQTSAASPLLKEIAPGVLEYNGVQLDKKNHRITFKGAVNQHNGLVEYLLVQEKGKVHESLLATKVMPHDIHVALLLIGLKDPTKENAQEPAPPSAIDSAYLKTAPKLKGPAVRISVAWQDSGKRKEVPIEDWMLNNDTGKPMSTGPWTYSGSLVENGVFLADQEFSIIATITDPTALVNNPRKGYDNDEIWQIRDQSVPPIDTPVEISISLEDTK
jgi:hypothetical protein